MPCSPLRLVQRAASFVPSADEAIHDETVGALVFSQVTPPSFEIKIPAVLFAPTIFVPSEEQATEVQLPSGAPSCSVQLAPAFVEVSTPGPTTTSFIPFTDEATEVHLPFGAPNCWVQVAPEFVETKIPDPAATSLIPSDEEAAETQTFVLVGVEKGAALLHVKPESVEV